MYRERVLDLYHDGFGNRQISREIRSSPGFVQKVIDRYNEQNTSLRGIRVGFPSPKIDEQVMEYIEVQKVMKPSTYSTELQQRLLLDGVVHLANLPSVSQINKVSRKELVTRPSVRVHWVACGTCSVKGNFFQVGGSLINNYSPKAK